MTKCYLCLLWWLQDKHLGYEFDGSQEHHLRLLVPLSKILICVRVGTYHSMVRWRCFFCQAQVQSKIQVQNSSPKSKIHSPEERNWDWGWQYNPTGHHPTTSNFSPLKCQSSDGKRPSMTFLDLPWPSLTFHDLPWPSMTFYDLLWPFITF